MTQLALLSGTVTLVMGSFSLFHSRMRVKSPLSALQAHTPSGQSAASDNIIYAVDVSVGDSCMKFAAVLGLFP